jgi:iron(III) transport system substrate-binding protein
MKKNICFTIIFTLAIPFISAGGGKDKVENKIVIYTSMYQDVIDVLQKDLQKKFSNCKIEFVYGGTGRLQERIAAEKASGRLGCDILMVAEPSYSLELKEAGVLHRYKSAEVSNLAFEYDPDGYWYPVRVSNMVLAYNPQKYSKNSIPNSFYNFANDASVRGAVSMRNPLVSGTTMAAVTALRDKYGYDYFDALGRQKIIIEYGADEALRKLETGEYKVIMVLEESVLKIREENNSKLEVIYPADGAVVIPSTIMIISGKWSANGNVQAAEAITDWFLSEEGQSAIVDGWMHSVRVDFPRFPYDSISIETIRNNGMPVKWENIFRQRTEIHNRFQDYMARR